LTLTKIIATVITCLLLVEILIGILAYRDLETTLAQPITMAGMDNIRAMGTLLYGKYLFPFEVASILLLVV
jgi:NADH-quinone oxidoreductase subunit J